MKKTLFLVYVLLFSVSLASCSAETKNAKVNEVLFNGGVIMSDLQSGSVNKAQELTLKYDDRYIFPDAIDSIETVTVTSKAVGTEEADEAVIRQKSSLDRDVGIACGVGTAKVVLKNGDIYNVTVEAAPISVFLMIGQSNTEGSTTSDFDVYNKARNQSVVCEEGQVYSTYAWSTLGHAERVAGITSSQKLSEDNAAEYVAKSLTSKISHGGTALEYPLNTLSAGAMGKVGYDSALAWNWNRLTGEKVWVVNCGAGSTSVDVWQPGEVRYENCVAIMENVKKTMDAEIAAGHYELKNYAYFWLQGETDRNMEADEYLTKFETLHTNLKTDAVLTDGATLEGCGIVMVRAFTTTNPSTDTTDNGPRTAQKAAIADTDGVFADVYLACGVNDSWITKEGVTDYWEEKYPNSVYPFSVHAQAYTNPTEIATVHTGVHYLQPGYNEIGMVAAQTALDALRK